MSGVSARSHERQTAERPHPLPFDPESTRKSDWRRTRALADCRGRLKWPSRGVYFFHETGENRSDTGEGRRIPRSERMR